MCPHTICFLHEGLKRHTDSVSKLKVWLKLGVSEPDCWAVHALSHNKGIKKHITLSSQRHTHKHKLQVKPWWKMGSKHLDIVSLVFHRRWNECIPAASLLLHASCFLACWAHLLPFDEWHWESICAYYPHYTVSAIHPCFYSLRVITASIGLHSSLQQQLTSTERLL